MFSDHSGMRALEQHDKVAEPMLELSMVQVCGLAKQLQAIGAQCDAGVLCASMATGHLTEYLDKVMGASRDDISRCVAAWFDGIRIAELN
jgi:hypothetical protein